MNEFEIIARYFAPLASRPDAFALKDDAAIIRQRPGFDLVVTTDQVAQGTDFFASDAAFLVAKKALRVNLSDLAAKGASPDSYLLSLSLPQPVVEEWLQDFASGLKQDQEQFGVSLLGGDTSATPGPPAISITAFGFVPQGRMVKRSGARFGDSVYVTGTIGDSAGGLAILKGEGRPNEDDRCFLVGRYHLPEPPVPFAPFVLKLATAAVDVSDGLIADLGHIAAASQVAIALDGQAIPRSPSLLRLWGEGRDAMLRAASAGDDYQIAFTADPRHEPEIFAAAAKASVRVSRVGAVEAGEGIKLLWQDCEISMPQSGYRHF